MTTDDSNVIDSYTDEEALADGFLVRWDGPEMVNRITRAVFDHFTAPLGESAITGPVRNVTRLRAAVETVVKVPFDPDGWRAGIVDGRQLWLVPNEVGGFTLMFPEDY
jgi:hypothetical protein